MRAPLEGGTPTTLAMGQTGLSSIAVDDTHVYWASVGSLFVQSGAVSQVGSVMKMSLDGGAVETLATGAGYQAVTVDGTSVYWLEGYVEALPGAGVWIKKLTPK